MKQIYLLIIAMTFFSACSYRDGSIFEDIYTDTEVIKPSAHNYGSEIDKNTTPIIKEKVKTPTSSEKHKSVHLQKRGRITNVTFDDEVKLYVYTFVNESNGEYTIFYYDKKLNFPSNILVDVDILDNYLITANKHTPPASETITQKKKYIKHKKINHRIKEAIEEKIDTL